MAQWMGQFSGFTHETKIQVIEQSLRQAITSFTATSGVGRKSKAKAVRHLSERLLTARLKALGARISALTEPGKMTVSGNDVSHLKIREEQLQADGVDGILKEFGFHETSGVG